MNKIRMMFSASLLIVSALFGFVAQNAPAQQQQGGVRSEREVRRAVQSLNAKIDDFRYRLSYEANDNSGNNQARRDLESVLRLLADNVRDFESKFNSRRENAADASKVLDAARNVDRTIAANQLSSRSANDWASIRTSFEQLAANYNITNLRWNGNGDSDYSDTGAENRYPNDNGYPNTPNGNRYPANNRQTNNNNPLPQNSVNNALTGTYRLDASRSENVDEIVARALRSVNTRGDNSQAQSDLRQKLEAPEQIAVEVRAGNQITLASSRAPQQIRFTADGRESALPTTDGKTARLRSTLRGQDLSVSSIGGSSGEDDYTVVFSSIDNGKSLRVTRRVTTDYLNETVFAESVYTKTDGIARLGIDNDSNDSGGAYSSSDRSENGNYPNGGGNNNQNGNYPNANYPNANYPTTGGGRTGSFGVPNGVILTGTLQNDVSTKFSQNNDRFRLDVTAPNEFRGAVIEGRLSGLNRSGKVSGRSQLTFNFETIRLANGQTYDFAGFLQNVTDANGKVVKVDTEGAASGSSRTKETVKRGGIGAGLGAVIGAIAGGAQGAAIGAILGGGAGAGSVVVEGKEDLELKAGSSISVRSSAPSR